MFNTVADIFEQYNKTLKDLVPNHPVKGPIQYNIIGEGGGDWYLEIDGVNIIAHQGTIAEPVSIVECETQAYIDLKNGKVSHNEILADKRMKLIKGIRNILILSTFMVK